ncbi:MAG: hypothetical protein VYE77_09720 [Planctomycetota bacterium]|nr:hypothetical protein [Planctomycetota bacterium]
MGQVVDTVTAKEFMAETLNRVDADELARICAEVEAKSEWFQQVLSADNLAAMPHEDFQAVLRRIFATRGKTRRMLLDIEWSKMRDDLSQLLFGDDQVAQRLESFVGGLRAQCEDLPENLLVDFATELLHFSQPDRCWLWTRWMWDARTKTGALPLVTTAAYDLSGESVADIYVKVGRAIAFVHEVGESAGFQRISKNVFGTDVFLTCVYTVYTYTVLRIRMTKEFNKVMPMLPELSRRLLGVYEKPSTGSRASGTVGAPNGAQKPEV